MSAITEIDYALDCAMTEIDTTNARAELAALRASAAERDELKRTVQAQAKRIAWLTHDIGEDGLASINRLIAACEHGDGIDQHAAPDLSIARDEIVKQAAQLEQARSLLNLIFKCSVDEANDAFDKIIAWLAANAPQDVKA